MNRTSANQNPARQGLIVLLAVVATACAASPRVDTVYQSNQCGPLEAGLHLLDGQDALERIAGNSRTLPLNPREGGARLEADFSQRHVFVISEGERSTAGYSIRLSDTRVEIEGDSAIIPVQFSGPDGDFAAQVITSPCLVLALDKGPYDGIRAGEYSLRLPTD